MYTLSHLVVTTVGPELHDVTDDVCVKMRKFRDEYRDEGVRVFLLVGSE